MKYLWYVFAGLLSGIVGGMGMGGGTLLIPLLSIFYSVNQHTAQAINLISFIPMSIVAIIIHLKNKLINFNKIMEIILPGVLFSIFGYFTANVLNGELLKRIFGAFLLLLSIFQLIHQFKIKK